jgi:hypothetical protein
MGTTGENSQSPKSPEITQHHTGQTVTAEKKSGLRMNIADIMRGIATTRVKTAHCSALIVFDLAIMMCNYRITTNGRSSWEDRRKLPYAFTEHRAVMAGSIMNCPQGCRVNVYVVRAFLRLKNLLSAHAELAAIVSEHEGRLDEHEQKISLLIKAITKLITPPEVPQQRLGFRSDSADKQ